ncbi:condensation domain-containing protein, partial [Chitinophaga sp. Cy-1792]|uniref:condensation domain-containing protein n=1 Tax=Chitinophaga sp. Cy-1792 TaxID=2608339 RepID=UPI001F04934D
MKDVKTIIRDLRAANVRLSFSGEELAIEPHDALLSEDLLQKIHLHKDSLIAWFRKNQQKSFTNIPAVASQESYVLSSSQRRLWLLSQLEDSNVAYNIPRVYLFEGLLDTAAVAAAFHSLISRHESLRTVFRDDETGEIRQWVLPPEDSGFQLHITDLSGEHTSAALHALVRAQVAAPFDLAHGPLLRAAVIRTAPDKWVFAYVMHHIISDGWSMGILLRELLQFYEMHTGTTTFQPAPLRIHYKDYAAWQQEQLGSQPGQAHQAYWLQQFEGELPVLELPGDRPRPAIKTYNGALASRIMDASLGAGIKTLGWEQGATFFMSLLAAVNALLYYHTGQTDIVIGSPVAGRDHKDLEDQIGAYINTLPLRMRFNPDWNFVQLLTYIKDTTLKAFEHQAYPLDELVGELQLLRDRSRNPLFDVLLAVTERERDTSGVEGPGGLKIRSFEGEGYLQCKVDLSFNLIETANGSFYAGIEYNTDIYQEETIQRLLAHMEELLRSVIQAPLVPLNQLNILTAKEKEQLLTAFNDIPLNYTERTDVLTSFKKQVAQHPDHIAVVFEQSQLTYAA